MIVFCSSGVAKGRKCTLKGAEPEMDYRGIAQIIKSYWIIPAASRKIVQMCVDYIYFLKQVVCWYGGFIKDLIKPFEASAPSALFSVCVRGRESVTVGFNCPL